jgi:hypothetical protein
MLQWIDGQKRYANIVKAYKKDKKSQANRQNFSAVTLALLVFLRYNFIVQKEAVRGLRCQEISLLPFAAKPMFRMIGHKIK